MSTAHLSPSDRAAIAARWLRKAGLPATTPNVHRLLAHVQAYGRASLEETAAVTLLRHDRLPTEPEVERHAKSVRPEFPQIQQRVWSLAPDALRFIATYVDEHGHGPGWVFLGDSIGLESRRRIGWVSGSSTRVSSSEVELLLRGLLRRSLVTFTAAPNSLDTTALGRACVYLGVDGATLHTGELPALVAA